MGAVYRRKKRSCPMCKPNKVGRAPARSPKEIEKLKAMDKEVDEMITQRWLEDEEEDEDEESFIMG
jgi:hypothetical protein